MRAQLGEGLAGVEIIGEFRPLRLLARPHGRRQAPAGPILLAQGAHQFRVFRKTLHQNGPRAIERGLHGLDALFGIDEGGGLDLRIVLRLAEERVRQRRKARLDGDERLAAALGLEGQVDIFQPRLGVGLHDGALEGRIELALLADGVEDRLATVLHLAQIAQALFEVAQLGIVELAGCFLAVAGDERHRRALVQQLDGGGDLALVHTQFVGDTLIDRFHHGSESGGATEAPPGGSI